ncbi:MAG: hypothetical protein ETSY1_26885 [Candidatus Entotheonella factor]|uniref:IclR family transcriptional regulator n=1 Tax=Entotheonella factor TaxID=1429438 RepID=W4LEH1_ENTF1|nr:IclR family transcriptional regulator [Candidatus Entotheonella palauensis]ETW96372.1 MAG: hypothetical protein ETSY1_26885 [Candidatus Entotheonella factor]
MATPLNGSLMKGFAILKLFSSNRPEITAAVVSRELGMNAATAHRFLNTLEEIGALVSHRRGCYALGLEMVELGRLAESINPLATIVQPVISELSRELNESAMACRLGRGGPVCIASAVAARPIAVSVKVGEVLELHASAHGKIWLASMRDEEIRERFQSEILPAFSANTLIDFGKLREEIESVRQQGYAQNRGEHESYIGAVAVPVNNKDGETFLSLSVFGMVDRFDEALIKRSRKQLMLAANEIAQFYR